MHFDDVAARFAKLEATGRRLSAVHLIVELFDRAARDDLPAIVYLLQGQLRPPYEGIELGLGERLLTRALALASGATEAAVTRQYRRLGDLGLVAAALAPPSKSTVSVQQVYAALLEIAQTGGSGAVARKTEAFARLIKQAGPLGAKYLVRIAQGRLRLGIGDATIIEATAEGALGHRNKKHIVEHAYNVRTDLGGVVRLAYAKGERALTHLGPEVGVPIRPALAQRLPSAEAIIKRLGTARAEPKYDGFRLQVHRHGARVWVFSRRLEDVSAMFPELAAAARNQIRARRAILEGEAVGYDPKTGRFLPFQVTITRKRKHGAAAAAARHPLRLYVFDLLYANGRDYVPLPLRERQHALSRLVRGTRADALAVTEAIETDRPAELERYFRAVLGRGLEGIVAKRPEAPYRAGARGYDWVKLKRAYQSKLRDTVDVVVVGYLAGRGKRASLGIGSLLGAVYDPEHDRFRTVAKIGSGPSEAEWRGLRRLLDRYAGSHRPARVDSLITPDVWVEPRIVIEVLADEVTRSPRHTCGKVGDAPGYALRFPRMLDGVRSDRAPEDATTEREVLDLHRMERRRS